MKTQVKRSVHNTQEEVSRNPIHAMSLASPGAIERQEAQGQKSFVKSDTLPTDMSPECKAALESFGFKFVGEVPGDPLFQFVEFPPGWKKKPTDHSMWSELLDPTGKTVASIFYKAAFYDRGSHMHLAQIL
jgi:hypothetical protein